MSSSQICNKCGSNEIEVDRARGTTYCTNCGNVLEESIIVSEVQMEEGAGGGCNVIGQFVSSGDTRAISSIHGLQNTLRESKEITLQNGRRLINEMASQLRLNQRCVDTAFNFYKLAVQRGLTRGRKIRQVIAACLYLVCRTEGTPHMLLDLCDIVHDDACYISSLGKLAMKFAYLLCIKLPEIDPGLFIPRFAQKLDFGDKTHEVTLTALRLVQRMNRDWMATGRRPSGLCGAALLVSARMYDFERTLDDIVKVVKIGKSTLRKRMLEFEDTPTSNLTVDEFHTIDLEEEHDPPAYTRSKKFAKIKQIEEMANIVDLEREIVHLQENIEAALTELQKPRGIIAKYSKLTSFEEQILGPNKDLTNVETEIKEAAEFLSEEQINIIKSIVVSENNQSQAFDENKWLNIKPSLSDIEIVKEDSDVDSEDLENYDSEELDDAVSDISELEQDELDSEFEELDVEGLRKRRKRLKVKKLIKKRRLLKESEQMPVVSSETGGKSEMNETSEIAVNMERDADELDLTGIDDQEIESMILSKVEIKTKAKLWLRANKDWLKEQKEKEELKKKEREEMSKNMPSGQVYKAKKTRVRKPKNNAPVANPQEAIERMLQEKKLSSKINYDVLKNLNKDLKK
ncbi:transcription factor IIIB 90 kDa subunit-like isoform X1 [Brachionus plicatilis]|uniref:B-related factor 1 n=1 Tax=Brachionus plicatilis TaxID=10195 RepID=A0A3M7T2Z3_BRAPC|nr:transcription factor IIIB 90 kDa subunit-like isoform X1 [Brachionus plicatilis]